MINQTIRTGLYIAGALVVAWLALRLLGTGGHTVANTASDLQQKF